MQHSEQLFEDLLTITRDDIMKSESECTAVGLEIKTLCEVEKIWITYDLKREDGLDLYQLGDYLRNAGYPLVKMTDEEITKLFYIIDLNEDNLLDKKEMAGFMKFLLERQADLKFKIFEEIVDKKVQKEVKKQ